MLKTIVCAVAIITILGCNGLIPTNDVSLSWTKFGGKGRLFCTKTELPPQLEVVWDIKLGNTMAWSNIVCDSEFLYAVIDSGRGHEIVKIRKSIGSVLANNVFRNLPRSIEYQLELVSNRLVVLCDSEMIVLDTCSMNPIWSQKTRISNIQSMAVSDDNILAASTDGYAFSLILSTGMPHWEVKLPEGFDYEFVSVKDSLAIFTGFGLGEGNSLTVCIDVDSGETKWSYISDGVASKPPQIAKHNVFITETGKFTCLDIEDGSYLWTNRLKDDETDHPVTTDVPVSISSSEVIYIVGDEIRIVNLRHGHIEKQIFISADLIPKFIVQSDKFLFVLSDGSPFLYQYRKSDYELVAVVNGMMREVTSISLADELIVQTRESIICLK